MADVENPDGEPKPVKKKPVRKPAAGSISPVTIAAVVIALAALGLSIFMFLQLQAVNKTLKAQSGELPKGLSNGHETGNGHGAEAEAAAYDWKKDPNEVVYNFGDITANTSDARYAKMALSFLLTSYYSQQEWDAYEKQIENFEYDKEFYFRYQAGEINSDGEELKADEHAYRPGQVILAAHTAPVEATPPPEMPDEVPRPLTRMERELQGKDAQVRSTLIKLVNRRASSELISEEGRASFEREIIDMLNELIDDHFGTIKEVFLHDLVVTTK